MAGSGEGDVLLNDQPDGMDETGQSVPGVEKVQTPLSKEAQHYSDTFGKGTMEDRQKVVDKLNHKMANDPEGYAKLPNHIKDAHQAYVKTAQGSDPVSMATPEGRKREQAINKATDAAAQKNLGNETMQGIINARADAESGAEYLAGGNKDKLAKIESNREQELSKYPVEKNYQGKTAGVMAKEAISLTPGLGNVMTAGELASELDKVGVGKTGSVVGAYAGLFSGKAGKKILSAGGKTVNGVTKAVLGKDLIDLTRAEKVYILDKLTETGAEKAVVNGIKAIFIGKKGK